MDSITLEFPDKAGNYLPSLKEFVLVLLDTVKPVPTPKNEASQGHLQLFQMKCNESWAKRNILK